MIYINTVDPIVAPLDPSELADWARLDSDDPTIPGILILATSLVINFLKVDLLTRAWSLKHKDWPTVGTYMRDSISPNTNYYKERIDLPYANLQAITTVKINNELTTDYIVLSSKPAQLQFDSVATYDNDNYALEVEYTAGYGLTFDDVPRPIRDAILMVGAYISSHRGGCDAGDPLTMSGAKMFLTPYAVQGGIVL
jgi:hypothetical protein